MPMPFRWQGHVCYSNDGPWHWRHHTLSVHKDIKNYKRGVSLLKRVYQLVLKHKTDDWQTYRFRAKFEEYSWGRGVVFKVRAASTSVADCDDMENVSQKIWDLVQAELLRCSVEIPRRGEYLGETYYAFFRKGMSEEYLKKRNARFLEM